MHCLSSSPGCAHDQSGAGPQDRSEDCFFVCSRPKNGLRIVFFFVFLLVQRIFGFSRPKSGLRIGFFGFLGFSKGFLVFHGQRVV